MISKCIIVLMHVLLLLYAKCVSVAECSTNGTDKSLSSTKETRLEPISGYRNEDVTQDVGYEHYLHSICYQGGLRKYHNCAIEDKSKPHQRTTGSTLAASHFKMEQHNNSLKKYFVHTQKKLRNPKLRFFIKKRNDIVSDNGLYGEYFMNPHTRFIKDINSLSEDTDLLHNYLYEQPTPQILLPADANILIVNKKLNAPMILSPVENVKLTPPPTHPENNAMHSGPMKVYVTEYRPMKTIPYQFSNIMVATKKPVNPIAQEVNQATHPYRFVTPFIEDVFRTRYKKPQKVIQINNHQQAVAASSQVVYKTKPVSPSPFIAPKKLSFWEKFVLTFFRLAK